MKKNIAIVLAGGKGKRMGGDIPKQYMEVFGKPILVYTLEVFESSKEIEEVVLVVGKNDLEYCKRNIVDKYKLGKVKKIVIGGEERYNSVYEGLKVVEDAKYVFIHDGARPLISEEIISDLYACVKETKACVAGVEVKDTIKKVNKDKYATETLKRNELWQIQTPQVFDFEMIVEAYKRALEKDTRNITDDAMIVEENTDISIKIVEGSYENIKITTLIDITVMEAIIKNRNEKKANSK